MIDKWRPFRSTLILLAIIMIWSSCSTTQYKAAGPSATKSVEDLSNGMLVIFLPSYKKQLDQLSNLIDSDEIAEDKTAAATLRYNELLRKRDFEIEEIRESFRKYYTFSDVKFSFDHQLAEIKEGGVVVEELLSDNTIDKMKIDESTFLFKYTLRSRLDQRHDNVDWDILRHDGLLISNVPNVRTKLNFWNLPQYLLSKDYRTRKQEIGYELNRGLNKFQREHLR